MSAPLVAALERLAGTLEGLDLRAASVLGQHDLVVTRDRVTTAIREYLIPRFAEPERPLLVVFAGPTGSGKSTLVNSLTGLELTAAGALRPTTSRPLVLTGDPDHGAEVAGDLDAEMRTGLAPVLEHMTFVDTPDIDSTATRHRVIAEALIDRADIVVFVVSASRYADAVPWEVLRRAMSRGATVVPVINRLGPGGSAVVTDFAARLRAAGLDVAPVRVPEHHLVSGAQRLPAPAVRELRLRLYKVARTRREHAADTAERVFGNTLDQAASLADRLETVAAEAAGFGERLRDAFATGPSVQADPAREWAVIRAESLLGRVLGRGSTETLASGLVAEVHGRLTDHVLTHAEALLARAGGLSAVSERALPLIEKAVRSWLDSMDPRGAAAALTDPEWGDDARGGLEAGLAGVWREIGDWLAGVWETGTGASDPAELRERVADLAAARQLVDA